MNEQLHTTYTGHQCKDKFRNLVNSHNSLCRYMAGNRTGRRSRFSEKYFGEFHSRFWERPEMQFDQIHNANASARRREESRRSCTPPPSYEEVSSMLDRHEVSLVEIFSFDNVLPMIYSCHSRHSMSPSGRSNQGIGGASTAETNRQNPEPCAPTSTENNPDNDGVNNEINATGNSDNMTVNLANSQNNRDSSRYTTPLEILTEFDISYKAIFSLRAIGVVKVNDEKPLNSDQIRSNINKLKSKLKKNTSTLYQHLFSAVSNVSVSDLTWRDPLGSQVISDDSSIVKNLPKHLKEIFMFINEFSTRDNNRLPIVLIHDGAWKETNIKLAEIATFGPEDAEKLNEGMYVTNMIVPAIHASLKNLPYGKSCYISTFECQSIASTDRRGEGRSGRRPDIIFVMKNKGKKYELMYTECSRLFCTLRKIEDDSVKLWRETNDGMYWTYKSCKPEKDEFGIIGLQVAGSLLRLTVLIRDVANVDRYYHLHEARIPVQYSDFPVVAKFIETLLIFRNILIVNMSLLPHGSMPKSERQKEGSSTVDSE
nr:12202_t:CDS:2 [Entrophospora candida]